MLQNPSSPQLSYLWWIPKSVGKCFGSSRRTGSSRQFVMIPHNLHLSFKLAFLCCGRLILFYPKPHSARNPDYQKFTWVVACCGVSVKLPEWSSSHSKARTLSDWLLAFITDWIMYYFLLTDTCLQLTLVRQSTDNQLSIKLHLVVLEVLVFLLFFFCSWLALSPSDSVSQEAWYWHPQHGSTVRPTECQGGQTGTLQGWSPPSPNAVTRGIRHTLNQTLQVNTTGKNQNFFKICHLIEQRLGI